MKKYQVVGAALSIGSGNIELTKAQAELRMHSLKLIKGDVYEVTAPIQFKIGEKIGYDGDLPKTLADSLKTAAEIKDMEREATAATEQATATARARLESEIKAGLDKQLRADIGKEMQDKVGAVMAERVKSAQAAADNARTLFEAEQDPARKAALEPAKLIAQGRLEEASDLFNHIAGE